MPRNFDLVICDGPPGNVHGGRSGLIPIMGNRLGRRSTILLDDVSRIQERDLARQWSQSIDATIEWNEENNSYAAIRKSRATQKFVATEPVVTVGIPVYNGAEFLTQSINSVMNQSRNDFVLMISDNDSEDATSEICKQYAQEDTRVRYFKQIKNIGIFENYNAVFLKCRTKYFKWQSSNDWSNPDVLQDCIKVLDENPQYVLACPKVFLVDEDNENSVYEKDFGLEMDDPAERFSYLLENIQLCNIYNGVIRVSALAQTGLNRSFQGSDVVLLAELALRGKFALLPHPEWYRRMTPSTASKLHSSEQKKDFFRGTTRGFDRYENWKRLFSLFSSVLSAPIKPKTRMVCLIFLIRKLFWMRSELIGDILKR